MKRTLLIPEGTKDYLREETYVQRSVMTDLLRLFSSWGYDEIKTPVLEKLDIVRKENGSEAGYFTLTDSTGDLLVLRPEFTAPVARAVATHYRDDKALPLRLSYAGEIFNQQNLKKGKKRQNAQVGIELIGNSTLAGDCEVLLMALESMEKYEIEGYSLGISHMGITMGLLEEHVKDEDLQEDIKRLMEQKDIVALEKLLPEYARERILTIASTNGGLDYLQAVKGFSTSPNFLDAAQRLETIHGILAGMGYGEKVFFDFSILSDFTYYTGLVFEGYGNGIGIPILSGGRYDNLFGEFTRALPAIGFAITADLYGQAMKRVIELPPVDRFPEEKDYLERFKTAKNQRSAGKRVRIPLEDTHE